MPLKRSNSHISKNRKKKFDLINFFLLIKLDFLHKNDKQMMKFIRSSSIYFLSSNMHHQQYIVTDELLLIEQLYDYIQALDRKKTNGFLLCFINRNITSDTFHWCADRK